MSPTTSSLALGGTITLHQVKNLTGLGMFDARVWAEKHAGPARIVPKRSGGGTVAVYPLPALAEALAARKIPGILPGGWCTLAFAGAQLADFPPAHLRKILGSPLVRSRMGASSQGTPCQLYALADVLSLVRNQSTISTLC